MCEWQQVSIHRHNPKCGKPHIFFDRYWRYSIPSSSKKNFGLALYKAYEFVKKLNSRGDSYDKHDPAYTLRLQNMASLSCSIPAMDDQARFS